MAIEIKSPTFPESVADGTVANWVKKEGDQVNQDEIIAEIETDKVVLEVVAPTDGILTKILKKEGDIVNSAEIIGEFDDAQDSKPQNKEKTETKEEVIIEKQDSPKALDRLDYDKDIRIVSRHPAAAPAVGMMKLHLEQQNNH